MYLKLYLKKKNIYKLKLILQNYLIFDTLGLISCLIKHLQRLLPLDSVSKKECVPFNPITLCSIHFLSLDED